MEPLIDVGPFNSEYTFGNVQVIDMGFTVMEVKGTGSGDDLAGWTRTAPTSSTVDYVRNDMSATTNPENEIKTDKFHASCKIGWNSFVARTEQDAMDQSPVMDNMQKYVYSWSTTSLFRQDMVTREIVQLGTGTVFEKIKNMIPVDDNTCLIANHGDGGIYRVTYAPFTSVRLIEGIGSEYLYMYNIDGGEFMIVRYDTTDSNKIYIIHNEVVRNYNFTTDKTGYPIAVSDGGPTYLVSSNANQTKLYVIDMEGVSRVLAMTLSNPKNGGLYCFGRTIVTLPDTDIFSIDIDSMITSDGGVWVNQEAKADISAITGEARYCYPVSPKICILFGLDNIPYKITQSDPKTIVASEYLAMQGLEVRYHQPNMSAGFATLGSYQGGHYLAVYGGEVTFQREHDDKPEPVVSVTSTEVRKSLTDNSIVILVGSLLFVIVLFAILGGLGVFSS